MATFSSVQFSNVPAQSDLAKQADANAKEIGEALAAGYEVISVRDLDAGKGNRIVLNPDGTVVHAEATSKAAFYTRPTPQTAVSGAQPWASAEERAAAYRNPLYKTSQAFRNTVRAREIAS